MEPPRPCRHWIQIIGVLEPAVGLDSIQGLTDLECHPPRVLDAVCRGGVPQEMLGMPACSEGRFVLNVDVRVGLADTHGLFVFLDVQGKVSLRDLRREEGVLHFDGVRFDMFCVVVVHPHLDRDALHHKHILFFRRL